MDWNEFVQRLTRELVRLPDNAFLIVHTPGGFPYAQAMRYSNGLVGEVVANEFLPDHLRLSPVQEKQLAGLGWEPPGLHGHVNWWRFVPLPGDPAAAHPDELAEVERLGDQMAGALGEVYGVPSPAELRYRANQNGPDGGPLSMPALGLTPAEAGRGQLRQPFLGWEEFTERLACELAALDPQMVLVVHQRLQADYYTQALGSEKGSVHAESVSSEVLPDELRLDPAIEDRMAEVGWRSPRSQPDRSKQHPNWTYDLPAGATSTGYRRLAAMMVTALRDVQGAREPTDLAYEAFSGTSFIQLMDIGIDPADPQRINERRPQRPLPDDMEPPPTAPLIELPPAMATLPDVPTPSARTALPDQDRGLAAAQPLGAPPETVPPLAVPPRAVPPDSVPPAPASREGAPLGITPPATAPHDAASQEPKPPRTAPAEASHREMVPAEVELEARLIDARERADQQAYLALLLEAALFLPHPGPGELTRFATATFTDGTYVLAFTSPAAMERSLRGQADQCRRTTFRELARSWPRPEWQLAVNAGLPSAAYIDSGTIRRIAGTPPAPSTPGAPNAPGAPGPQAPPTTPAPSTAAVTPTAPATRRAPAEARAHATAPDTARSGTTPRPPGSVLMQKVVAHEHVDHYLNGGYDRVAGYVHRASDVAGLTTPEMIVRSLGLTYEDTPFSVDDEAIHVIRWLALKGALYRVPYGGVDELTMSVVPDGWVIEKPPFLGTGYAPGADATVPELKIDSQRLPHGAEMYRIDRTGRETFVALFDADRQTWIGRA